MSEQKNFEKYLAGEWYPGCPVVKSPWREAMEADFAARGIQLERPVVIQRKVAEVKKRRIRTVPKGQYNKDYMKQRLAEAIKSHTCTDCYNAPSRQGKTTCEACQNKRNARTMKRYYAKKVAA